MDAQAEQDFLPLSCPSCASMWIPFPSEMCLCAFRLSQPALARKWTWIDRIHRISCSCLNPIHPAHPCEFLFHQKCVSVRSAFLSRR